MQEDNVFKRDGGRDLIHYAELVPIEDSTAPQASKIVE
jgi:hypothetical protein